MIFGIRIIPAQPFLHIRIESKISSPIPNIDQKGVGPNLKYCIQYTRFMPDWRLAYRIETNIWLRGRFDLRAKDSF